MNEFLENLKREASDNPIFALGVGAALLSATSKLVEAAAKYKGSSGFAKDAKRRAQEFKRNK